MVEMKTIRRVTVVAEAALEGELLRNFLRLGARGYTVLPCRGKGRHEIVSDPYTGISTIRFELLVTDKTADDIIQYLHGSKFRHHALVVCVEHVEVFADEVF